MWKRSGRPPPPSIVSSYFLGSMKIVKRRISTTLQPARNHSKSMRKASDCGLENMDHLFAAASCQVVRGKPSIADDQTECSLRTHFCGLSLTHLAWGGIQCAPNSAKLQ